MMRINLNFSSFKCLALFSLGLCGQTNAKGNNNFLGAYLNPLGLKLYHTVGSLGTGQASMGPTLGISRQNQYGVLVANLQASRPEKAGMLFLSDLSSTNGQIFWLSSPLSGRYRFQTFVNLVASPLSTGRCQELSFGFQLKGLSAGLSLSAGGRNSRSCAAIILHFVPKQFRNACLVSSRPIFSNIQRAMAPTSHSTQDEPSNGGSSSAQVDQKIEFKTPLRDWLIISFEQLLMRYQLKEIFKIVRGLDKILDRYENLDIEFERLDEEMTKINYDSSRRDEIKEAYRRVRSSDDIKARFEAQEEISEKLKKVFGIFQEVDNLYRDQTIESEAPGDPPAKNRLITARNKMSQQLNNISKIANEKLKKFLVIFQDTAKNRLITARNKMSQQLNNISKIAKDVDNIFNCYEAQLIGDSEVLGGTSARKVLTTAQDKMSWNLDECYKISNYLLLGGIFNNQLRGKIEKAQEEIYFEALSILAEVSRLDVLLCYYEDSKALKTKRELDAIDAIKDMSVKQISSIGRDKSQKRDLEEIMDMSIQQFLITARKDMLQELNNLFEIFKDIGLYEDSRDTSAIENVQMEISRGKLNIHKIYIKMRALYLQFMDYVYEGLPPSRDEVSRIHARLNLCPRLN